MANMNDILVSQCPKEVKHLVAPSVVNDLSVITDNDIQPTDTIAICFNKLDNCLNVKNDSDKWIEKNKVGLDKKALIHKFKTILYYSTLEKIGKVLDGKR